MSNSRRSKERAKGQQPPQAPDPDKSLPCPQCGHTKQPHAPWCSLKSRFQEREP